MRVAVVEDHRVVADLLAAELRALGHDAQPVDAADADSVLIDPPDLAVLDLQLGSRDGVDLIGPLVAAGTRVVVLSGTPDAAARARCVELGALAVLDKAGGLDRVIDVLRRVVEGEVAQSGAERARLLEEGRAARAATEGALAPFATLTGREQDVLALLVTGRSVTEIATELFLSVETVRSYVKVVLRKLGVSSQLAAVAMAVDAGWKHARSSGHA